jgi:hypothetical protein
VGGRNIMNSSFENCGKRERRRRVLYNKGIVQFFEWFGKNK